MNPYTNLAQKAVEAYIEKGKVIEPSKDLPKEMTEKKAGAFVTIEEELQGLPTGQAGVTRGEQKRILRGCIGTYLPTRENIAQEIIHNAIAAATEDYRFGTIEKKELPNLSYTVYILEPPELVKEIRELDPKKYGIIVKTSPISHPDGTDVVFNGHSVPKSALLLPDLEGIDTIEKQILITCQKGEIDPLKEKIIIYKFKVEKFSSEK